MATARCCGTPTAFSAGIAFSALGISNAELLYPGCIVNIKEILVNGDPYEMTGEPYTTSDDGKCTRVNLYNAWVGEVPENARTVDGDISDATAVPVDGTTIGEIDTLEITFELITDQ